MHRHLNLKVPRLVPFLLVIHKGIHEQPLVDELLPLGLFISKVSVVVVGDDDAIRLVGELDNEAVVIANHASSLHPPRGSEDENLLLLKATQDFLICMCGWTRLQGTVEESKVAQAVTPRPLSHVGPVIGASGRDCSFLHAGTNTVTSLWPRSTNQSTASWIPWQENTSLLPWLWERFDY